MKNGMAKKLIGEIKPGTVNLIDFRSAVPSRKPGSVTRTPHLVITTVDNKKLQIEFLEATVLNENGPSYKFSARIVNRKNKEVVGFVEFKNEILKQGQIYTKEFSK